MARSIFAQRDRTVVIVVGYDKTDARVYDERIHQSRMRRIQFLQARSAGVLQEIYVREVSARTNEDLRGCLNVAPAA